ncbi:MAG TPA: hypothetical protein VHR66_24405 [Gemmataceae bacterium]|jgi:hypothetical protein|nr:hypothetical protein [Gemmataceae bacterium]
MMSDVDELNRLVGMMPSEMAREVLNFARFLHSKSNESAAEPADWEDDFSSRYQVDDPIAAYHPWDAADGVKDVA